MDNQTYVDLFSSSTAAWLASRCVSFNSGYAEFRICYVSGGTVDASYLYGSYNSNYSNSYAVRPVVEIDLSKVNVGLTGDGNADTPYSIEAK